MKPILYDQRCPVNSPGFISLKLCTSSTLVKFAAWYDRFGNKH